MRRNTVIWLGVGFLAAALLIPVGGCGKKTGELDELERRLPRMEEAKKRERSGDSEGAMELYRDVLIDHPETARAHLELGILSDRDFEDKVTAIYHYRRYLSLRPDTEKRVMLEQLIQMAEFSFATSITNHPAAVVGEMARLNEQVAGLEEDLATARGRITDLRRDLADARTLAARAEASLEAGAARPESVTSGSSGVVAPEPRTYRVQRGDTLSRIAQKVYNDSNQWKMIYEANRETMKRSNDLDVGQVLVIP